jgi:rare lipoprotein A
MRKIITMFAGLMVSLSLVSETKTDGTNIIYIKKEMMKAADDAPYLTVSKKDETSLVSKPEVSEKKGKHSQSGVASYYSKGLHGSRTASGERHNSNEMVAAHKSLPFGTKVKVTNLSNGKEVIVKINDRGPFAKGRVIDLSYGAFSKIESPGKGLTKVKLEVLNSLNNLK